jgi:uncharacterized protein
MKKTLVIGASTNPERYSFKAIQALKNCGNEVVAIGLKGGNVEGIEINSDKIQFKEIDTITLYLGPGRQPDFYNYIVSLHPVRVIFNPGTENEEFRKILEKNGIKVTIGCTLVLLSSDLY